MSTLTAVIINDILILILYFVYVLLVNKKYNKKAEEEIISMVNESHEQGYIEDNEAEMINNIFEFGDKQAKDIMTDRSNIVAIDVSTKLSDALEVMLDANNSRFPVYDGDLDHIVGIIHLKDAMRLYRVKGNPLKRIDSIDGILREARCIPQTRKIDKLFSVMQATKLQMVVVIDEYGQTSGIVAMRDILEEIVGNILDEYDLDEDMIVEHGNDKYIIEGITPLEDLEKKLMIKFETDEFETINGFLISKMERIPDKKTKFDVTVDGYNFKVLEVNHNMIQQVLVTKDSDTVSEKADVKEE